MGVKKYREDKKLTQTYIADVLNVKSATVSKYESNQIEPNIDTLKKYSEIFEVTLEELLKYEEMFFNIVMIRKG